MGSYADELRQQVELKRAKKEAARRQKRDGDRQDDLRYERECAELRAQVAAEVKEQVGQQPRAYHRPRTRAVWWLACP